MIFTNRLPFAIFAGTSLFFAACNNEASTASIYDSATVANKDAAATDKPMEGGLMAPVNAMTAKMKALKMSGDFDQDFATVMIENHQGAVDISEMALPKVTDPEIKTMAQRMVDDHKAEIADLKKFLGTHDTTSADHRKMDAANHTHDGGEHHELSDDLNAMMAKMMSGTVSGNANKDYVTLMLAHHQNAKNLAQDELTHGHHAELKALAKKMMDDDTKEIAEFEKWLAKMK